MSSIDETELARRFPGWSFWWSRDSEGQPAALHATRLRRLTDAETKEGLAQTLPYGVSGDLLQQLEQQKRLSGRRA
jgi:hypothetical protein